MRIIGAGLAGLLTANLLRHKNPVVLEKQAALPNNHSAVLRFRSSIISDVTGIPFRKVQVLKASLPWLNPVADALAYAEKNTGSMRSDRSIPMQMTSAERYIAPQNLIRQLADGLNIRYEVQHPGDAESRIDGMGPPIISTIPMPALMEMLGYSKKPTFDFIPGCNLCATVLHCDAYASLYIPNPFYPFSRISLTGDEIVAEIPNLHSTEHFDDYELIFVAAGLLGIHRDRVINISMKRQGYAKILPIDEGERTRFITWATDEYNIYSLGRYACWRPGLLLDDLVQDIRLIERWINGYRIDGRYGRKLHDNRIKHPEEQDCILEN